MTSGRRLRRDSLPVVLQPGLEEASAWQVLGFRENMALICRGLMPAEIPSISAWIQHRCRRPGLRMEAVFIHPGMKVVVKGQMEIGCVCPELIRVEWRMETVSIRPRLKLSCPLLVLVAFRNETVSTVVAELRMETVSIHPWLMLVEPRKETVSICPGLMLAALSVLVQQRSGPEGRTKKTVLYPRSMVMVIRVLVQRGGV